MAKTGYTTFWVHEADADHKILRAQHERAFPGNELAVVEDKDRGRMVKVAVMVGEAAPLAATTVKPVPPTKVGAI